MLGEFGAGAAGVAASADTSDARTAALHLMSEALARLDGDSSIPAVIGAQLQSAIDALWTSGSSGHHSNHLH
jgi:hypothetical protein